MKVNVTYNTYNTGIEKAEIEVLDSINEEMFEVFTVADLEAVDTNKLVIKAKNSTETDGIALEMTVAEAKQFNLLINQFLRNM